jgi:hypothetical protein
MRVIWIACFLCTLHLCAEEKKVKPHFAGARAEEQCTKPKTKKKRVKNRWFLSKTQPKTTPKEEEEEVELPDDRPRLVQEEAAR